MSSSTSVSPASQIIPLLQKHKLDAYLVPTADAHQSEYVADCDKRRAFISNFTGSAGFVVLSAFPSNKLKHQLWTDGRYFLQAAKQLTEDEFQLQKQGFVESIKIEDWISGPLYNAVQEREQQSNIHVQIGADLSLLSMSQYQTYTKAWKEQGVSISIISLPLHEGNLVDQIWGSKRPSRPNNPLIILSDSYTGESSESKLKRLRLKMAEKHVTMLIISSLDEIAWLLNIRGSDIDYNPVFFSYLIITNDTLIFFVSPEKITDGIEQHLPKDIQIKTYDSFFVHLTNFIQQVQKSSDFKVWLDPAKTSQAIASLFTSSMVYEAESPVTLMKSLKNSTELQGIRNAHIRDSAAMCQFLTWIEAEVTKQQRQRFDECFVATKLEELRSQQKDFIGLSFDTIAGSGSNGAIIHYKPEPSKCALVDQQKLFLLDSGAQYRDGTTDITRTMHFGQPTDFERRCFTLVLKGHIALAKAVFPPSVAGPQLDVLARQFLWKEGLDYQHGTGHGVGAFLNVHEGPQGIGASVRNPAIMNTFLQAGMTVTNEPGYYHTDPDNTDKSFGIRIENLMIIVEADTPNHFNKAQYLKFETASLTPIQVKMIDVTLLTLEELDWVNAFHRQCREKIGPLLTGEAKEWLISATQPLSPILLEI